MSEKTPEELEREEIRRRRLQRLQVLQGQGSKSPSSISPSATSPPSQSNVSPSLHASTTLSSTSPVSSVTSSPSSSLEVKIQKSTPVVQDNKDNKKQKSVDSKKVICDAIERIFCVDIQTLGLEQSILNITNESGSLNTYDIINQVLMERLISNQNADENMDIETSQGGSLSLDIMDTSERTISPSKKLTESDMAASPTPDNSSPVNMMLSYLIKCYDRVTKEEKTMSKKHEVHLKELIAQCKELCTSFSVLVIRGTLTGDDNIEENSSVLFTYMIDGSLPTGYLHDLVLHCHNESNDGCPLLKMIFHPVLQHLRENISKVTIRQEKCTNPLSVLAELCDIKPQGSTFRPICVLVSTHVYYMYMYLYAILSVYYDLQYKSLLILYSRKYYIANC